jgi:hypothetical protein
MLSAIYPLSLVEGTVPKLTLYFPDDFDDDDLAGSSFCLDAPDGDHGHSRPGEWIIGRSRDSDLTILVRAVSRKHCAISYSYAADRWSISDLGSTSGTYVNGVKLAPNDPSPLKVGDRLHLGPCLINVVEDENDTVGGEDDDGPSTIATTTPSNSCPWPSDHQQGELVAPARTYADAVYLGVAWLVLPSTLLGKIYRLIVVGVAVAVVIIIMAGAS